MFLAISLLFLSSAVTASADFQCTIIPGGLTQIDAGAGQVCGVSGNQNIYCRVDDTWKQIPGGLKHVTVGPAGLWGVAVDNTIFKFQNNGWMHVVGELKQVDAGGDKFLGGVNAKDNVFCLRQSCVVSRSNSVTFTPLDGLLKYYSCGPLGCWGVNKYNQIYYRYNVKPND
ncbi:fish-egg lectin-like, partial [Gastrophryne carolinensis]